MDCSGDLLAPLRSRRYISRVPHGQGSGRGRSRICVGDGHACLSSRGRQCRIDRSANRSDALTPKQTAALRDYADGREHPDFDDYYGTAGALAFRNRERVIEALMRRGLVDENGITTAGRDLITRVNNPIID